MKTTRPRPDSGPVLTGSDLIAFEHSLKDELAAFLPFESYSLYFPDFFDEASDLWEELAGGKAVHLAEERGLLVPLIRNGVLLAVFVARGVKLSAPKALPPLIVRAAGLVLDKLALYKASVTDALTGLANSEHLTRRITEEIELVRECILPGSGTSMDPDSSCYSAGFGLILARLDGLARLYERQGSALGDEAAAEAAKAFAAHCRDRALCARPEPDILAMLLPGATPGTCRETAEAAAKDLVRVLVTDPVLESSIKLTPGLGFATYPRDLDGGLSFMNPKDQAMLLLRRAGRAAQIAGEHGAGQVFSHQDVKNKGGRILSVLRGGRVSISLGRDAGAAEGERYLVRPAGDRRGTEAKAEVILLKAEEGQSLAEVVYTADPSRPPKPGDALTLVQAGDRSESGPRSGPPKPDERTGLYSYTDFMDYLSRNREAPERFALFLTELPAGTAGELDEKALAQAAVKASEVLGVEAASGRYSLAGMIHFVPGPDRRKAKTLGLKLHKALSGGTGAEPIIGLSTHPYLSFMPADALDNCRKALEYARLLKPPRVGLFGSLALTISADKLFTEGRLFDAIEEYKLALIADGKNALARNSLGVSLARAGRLSEAARNFKMVMKRDPADVSARYNYGYACMRMDKHKEAEEAFSQCLKLSPSHVYSLIRLGQIRLAQGRYEAAEKALRRAEKLEGGRGLTSRHLARLALARNRKDEAREHLHQALIHDPHDALAMNLMAELYLEEGEDPQIAEALARQSAAIRPEHRPFLKTLARTLEARGKTEEAAAIRARAGSL